MILDNRKDFKIRSINQKSPRGSYFADEKFMLFGNNKRIVPLLSIISDDFIGHVNEPIDLKTGELGQKILNDDFPSSIRELIFRELNSCNSYRTDSNYIQKTFYNMTDEEKDITIVKAIKEVRDKLNDYISAPVSYSVFDGDIFSKGRYYRYSSLMSHFWNGYHFEVMRTRTPNMMFVVGPYYLAYYDRDNKTTIPLVSLITQSKYIKILKYSYIMGASIDPKYVQLWIKEGFDEKDSIYSCIRPSYRKFIRKPILKAGIKIGVKSDMNILFNKFHGIPCNSIREYNEFLSDCSEEILSHLRKTSKIELEA